MVNQVPNIQIFFDLMNGLLGPKTEDIILKKNMPIFVKKLNCFMACVVKNENNKNEVKYLLPIVLQQNKSWLTILNTFCDKNKDAEYVKKYGEECCEYHFNDNYYYKFIIEDYGFLILGRKKPFDKFFKFELIPVINFLGKSLQLAVERKKLKDSKQQASIERNLLRTIIDNIPINIYVKDSDNNKILANKTELDYFGIEEESKFLEKTESELLPKRFFKKSQEEDNLILKNNNAIINKETEIFNEEGKKGWGLVSKIPLKDEQDKIIGLVGITIDITERKNIEESILRKQKMLRGIAMATDELIKNTNLNDAINKSLNILGEAVNVDRTYLFKNDISNENKLITSLSYLWTKNNINFQDFYNELQNIPLTTFSNFLNQINKREPFEITVSHIKGNSSAKKIFDLFDVKSVLVAPIFLKNNFWGFIGYDNFTVERHWSKDELSVMKSFGNSFSNALERTEAANELKEMALFPLQNPNPVVRINLKGEIVLKNKPAEILKRISSTTLDNSINTEQEIYKILGRKLNPKHLIKTFEINAGEQIYLATARLSVKNKYINIHFSNITKQKNVEGKLRYLDLENKKIIKSLKENEKYLEGINRFASKILKQNTIDEIIWEVTDNLIKEVGAVDCIIYLFDDKKKNLIQRAAYGPKQLANKAIKNPIVIPIGKGIVGSVAKSGKSELIIDTSLDDRYIVDCEIKLSEITVPIIADGDVIGVIDSEHPERNYYSKSHLKKFQTIANLTSSRLKNALNQEKLLVAQKSILKLSTAVELSSLSIVITGVNGIMEFVNPAFEKLSGYNAQEAIGKKINLLKSGGHSDSFYGQIWNTVLKGNKWTGEILNKRKNGDNFWALIDISPIIDNKGIITNFVTFQTDISKLKKLENDLLGAKTIAETADKSKSQFLANMSHEIRTPLNGIIGMIRELNKEQMSKKQMGYLDSAMNASKHLLSVVNNILEITKIETGELSLISEHFSLQELINDVVSILKPQIGNKNIILKADIDKNVSKAFIADESRIRQILINLTGNALKFTEKGEVIISCIGKRKSTKKQELNFIVRDTGIGMDEKYLTKIFKKFQQEDQSISRKFGGTGLGLFITKNLIELMGGDIEATSKKGYGSEFKVNLTLPIGDISKVEGKSSFDTNKSLENAKILLVEDNEMNRFVASNSLKSWDIKVVEAVNGIEAIELLKKECFDIILMDIQMPVMNGIDATKIIRNELKIQTPIIALSANAFKSEIDLCLANGMNNYITKPFEEHLLFKILVKHYHESLISDKNIINYNLSKLDEMSRGNQDFVQKMLHLFVDTVPDSLNKMNEMLNNEDIEGVKKIIHRIKPSLINMRIGILTEDIVEIENFDQKEKPIHLLSKLVNNVTLVLNEVIQNIQDFELKK